MSEGENAAQANGASYGSVNGEQRKRSVASSGRTLGARSASPAKRSAADMEDTGPKETKVPGSFTKEDTGQSDFDTFMAGMNAATAVDRSAKESMQVESASLGTSVNVNINADTMAANESGTDQNGRTALTVEAYTTEEIDKQVEYVMSLANKPLDEGDRGVVISTKWLSRVMSRSSENLKNSDYPKDAREGFVGPLDNTDIVPEAAHDSPYLKDTEGQDFVPMKPGLAIGQQYEILPYKTYGYILSLYGLAKPAKPIIRYAHNTAPDAPQPNIQYEVYPPVVTVKIVPQPASELDLPAKPTASTAVNNLRLKHEREGRGQSSANDAPRLVSSSTESFNKFLEKAKEAAGIPRSRRVKIWRLASPQEGFMNDSSDQQFGVPSPPASRETSPTKQSSTILMLDKDVFGKLEIGKDMDHIDLKDNTSDPNYKGIGSLSMDDAGLKTGVVTLILEEQIVGPAGGEFQSDSKKTMNRTLSRKGIYGSKTGSAQTSGRTSPAPGMMTRGRTRKDGRTRGTVGLMNLGNTCYMNSALQCIRSVEELALYFLSQNYKKEINNDNPLGHHGAMANAYAGVLRGIYESPTGGAFSPSHFKKTLGSIQPMFSGYGQQDSQEFLSFLVDALHEDLNRIVQKPYIENPDSDDSRVHDPQYVRELGEIYRENHRKRNDSVAMDLFSGFYKNTMECPTCDKVSVTFDPYSLLTVQLPMDHAFQHPVTFFPLQDRPILHDIDMDKNSTFKTLKEHIAKKHAGVDAARLWVIEMYSHKVYKTFDDATTLAEANIGASDHIFIYELDAPPRNTPSTKKQYTLYTMSSKKEDDIPAAGMESEKADVFAVPIFNRIRKNPISNNVDMILFPLYITLTRDEAQDYEVILRKVLIAVSNITTRAVLTEFNEGQDPNGMTEDLNEDEEPDVRQVNADDSTGISDHSTQSEDGYVNVSLDQRNGASSPMQIDELNRRVPADFMDPRRFLSPALRNHLFDVKYAESSDNNMHCASLSGFRDMSVRPMFDRVKKPSRRSSVQSSVSDDSSQGTDSGSHINRETDESDIDALDVCLGGGDSAQKSAETIQDSDDDEITSVEIMEPTPIDNSKHGRNRHKRRKGKKASRGTRGGANKSRESNPPRYRTNMPMFSAKNRPTEDGPYYVQLGECIVLDWRRESYDSLFNGDDKDPDEIRGCCIVDDNGRGGPRFEDEEVKARKLKRQERTKNGIDLEDCFIETGRREVLSEDNAWYCNRCKELRQAHKTLEIWTLPDILVVHMKRFGGTRSFRDKIDVFVDYPIDGLDMTDKVGVKEAGKEYIYDLFAVDNHFGGLGGGHYTAYAKNFYDGEWYDYNDSITSKVSSSRSVKSAAAYLLFYRRRSEEPLGSPALQELVSDFRKPVSESADEAEDESGEGKLGGPTLSSQHRHGSSSVSVSAGPGVEATSSQRGLGAGNGGAGAGSPLTQKQTMTSEYEDDEHGDRGVAGLLAWHAPTPGWNFTELDNASEELFERMNDGDNDSTKVEFDDRDSGIGGSSMNGMDTSAVNSPSGANNSPTLHPLLGETSYDEEGTLFSDAAMQTGDCRAQSIESSTHDIVLDDTPASRRNEHGKMD